MSSEEAANPYEQGTAMHRAWELFSKLQVHWTIYPETGMVSVYIRGGGTAVLGDIKRVAVCSEEEMRFTLSVLEANRGDDGI